MKKKLESDEQNPAQDRKKAEPCSSCPRRILFLSSTRFPWFESQNAEEHFHEAPYSINAIGYHLAQHGWQVAWSGWRSGRNPRSLARRIDQFRPSIIYTYGSTLALHPLLCRRLLCHWKYFKVVHGWDVEYVVICNDLFGWSGRILMDWMEKRIVKCSDAVITLSYFLQQKGRKWGVECHYIPNGADPVDTLEIADHPKLDGSFNIVYTGDKARWKRTIDICEAMRHVPKDIKLYLTGRDEEYLRPYASENCIFLGWLSKPEQYAVMSQADAFVVTSDQDCNAKLQEYLRWKKPILGYDGRANLFFQNGRNALLTCNYPAAIQRLASNPMLCMKLAENAAKDIPVYSWNEIAGQFETFFRELQEKHSTIGG